MTSPETFGSHVDAYANTSDGNDAVFRRFTEQTAANPMLAAHRRHVDEHKLGYGDPAFHYMWFLLLQAAAEKFPKVRCLEIGVFKGQVVSLWSLLARELKLPVEIHALTPLASNPPPPLNLWSRIRYRLDRDYREQVKTGNFYVNEDYEAVVRAHFAHHGLSFDAVRLHRGYSTDPVILESMSDERFEIIYVDGDHREAGARHDFATFGAKVVPGGWLVADDAAADLPGTAFWKGYPEVTSALSELAPLGFVNVLNVGHNRVFQRIG
ncbi:MAG: class I SAM-dependent methyltransferase [Opitutaceae bacterium]|jgi:hypothetical protein